MPRYLITQKVPVKPNSVPAGAMLIAPNEGVAQKLGVPGRTLQEHAKWLLAKNNFLTATPINAAATLRKAVREVVPESDASAIAAHYREMIGAVLRSGMDLEKLISVGTRRARTLGQIAHRYVDILQREKLVDSDAALSTAIALDLVKPAKVLIYGYFRARGAPARAEEIEFIDLLAGDGSIYYLPCGEEPIFQLNREWVALLKKRGWELKDSGEAIRDNVSLSADRFAGGKDDRSSNELAVEALEYPNLESEIRGMLARAKAAVLGGMPTSEIAVVCRDLDLYALPLISIAAEYGLPIEIDYGVPLGETAFGEFVTLLLETIQPHHEDAKRRAFQYEQTLRLMLHRFGPGLTDAQRSLIYKRRPSDFANWKAATAEVEPLHYDSRQSARQWIAWLRGVLEQWNTSEERNGESNSEIEARNKFFEALEELSPENEKQTISISDFAHEVVEVLANLKVPLLLDRSGVKVLMPNEIVGCEFRHVFAVGMAEGLFPAPSIESNIIDFCERKKLREHEVYFEDALEVPRWEELTFYFTLLACSGKITLSYPKFADNQERLASSFFKRLGITPARNEAEYVSSIPEYRRAYLLDDGAGTSDDVLASARHQYQVESRRESNLPQDEYDGRIGVPITWPSWSASSLSRIGSCPFKWFAHDVLKLKEIEEAETDLGGDVRGRLMHKTLELAVKRAGKSMDLRSAILEILEEEFANAEAIENALGTIANWELRRSEQIEKLRMAIVSEHFILEGASVLDTEKKFKADFCGLTVTGVIDRIDRLPDGKVVAIDYKSGAYISKVKDDHGYLKIDLQLPIYSQIAAPGLFPNTECIGGQFFHLSSQKVTKGKEADLEGFITRVKSLLAEGNLAVDPDIRHEACKYCEYDIVCRTGSRLMRKRRG